MRLTEELEADLAKISSEAAELRASRQRLVAAQDRERRRIEREIHEGVQQQLVSLAVKLGLLKQVMPADGGKAGEILSQLMSETQEALETLRDLARGIFPPLLAERGLAAALEAHIAKHSLQAAVEAEPGLSRFDQQVEAAAFFCCLEALQNASKHAPGHDISVHLGEQEGHLVFSVSDEGPGFDPHRAGSGSGMQNMKDRIEALGGTLAVESSPGSGTRITGRVPAGAGGAPCA